MYYYDDPQEVRFIINFNTNYNLGREECTEFERTEEKTTTANVEFFEEAHNCLGIVVMCYSMVRLKVVTFLDLILTTGLDTETQVIIVQEDEFIYNKGNAVITT